MEEIHAGRAVARSRRLFHDMQIHVNEVMFEKVIVRCPGLIKQMPQVGARLGAQAKAWKVWRRSIGEAPRSWDRHHHAIVCRGNNRQGI